MQLKRYAVAKLDQLEEGEALSFGFEHDGEDFEGFLVNYEGDLFAYRNRCVHVPMRLDTKEGGIFFSGNRKRIQCQSHGATFKPDTGECLSGPHGCPGEYLPFLALAVEDDQVYVVLQSSKPSEDPATVR